MNVDDPNTPARGATDDDGQSSNSKISAARLSTIKLDTLHEDDDGSLQTVN